MFVHDCGDVSEMTEYTKSQVRLVVSLVLLSIILICTSEALQRLFATWQFEQLSLHASIESAGAFAALVLAMLVQMLREHDRLPVEFNWIVVGLLVMGVFGGIHATCGPGNAFIWLHSLSNCAGGVIFCLVWLPKRITKMLFSSHVPKVFALISVLICITVILYEEKLPEMLSGNDFSANAVLLNLTGGLGFISACGYFAFFYQGEARKERFVFIYHCLLFGIAAFVFKLSTVWDTSWWFWHVLRLFSYFIGLYYFYKLYCQDVGVLRAVNDELKARDVEREADLSATHSRLVEEFRNRELVEADLRKAKEDAEAANITKSGFLSVMSHEIRTPMSTILGMSELLGVTKLNEQQRHYQTVIQYSGKFLLALLNDILDFSKIEAGEIKLVRVEFKPELLFASVVELLKPQIQAKNLHLSLVADKRVPALLIGDDNRLQQILVNLIGNAIKFTPQGRVEVNISLKEEHQQDVLLLFEVRDTGLGIDVENQKNLFSPFVQVYSALNRKQEGTGLGLTISKNLVEIMGGSIGFTSALGKGSVFWFTVKLGKVECMQDRLDNDSRYMSSSTLFSQNSLCAVRLLVVEDDLFGREVMMGMLDLLGFQVDLAENGDQALQMMDEKNYDLIFMDCKMPVRDGFATTAEIRRREAAKGCVSPIPIIALTANAIASERDRCFKVGMNDFLTKPAYSETLKEKVMEWLPRMGQSVSREDGKAQ